MNMPSPGPKITVPTPRPPTGWKDVPKMLDTTSRPPPIVISPWASSQAMTRPPRLMSPGVFTSRIQTARLITPRVLAPRQLPTRRLRSRGLALERLPEERRPPVRVSVLVRLLLCPIMDAQSEVTDNSPPVTSRVPPGSLELPILKSAQSKRVAPWASV